MNETTYIGLEAAGETIDHTKLIDGLLHCYHKKKLLQIVTPPGEDTNVPNDRQSPNRHNPTS